jgi:hypothetical protein
MKKLTAIAALFSALALSPASFAQTVYVPPGDEPRFGGEFALSDVGQVAGYWRSECYNWHVRSQSRRTGPLAAPPVDASIKRFVDGLIAEKPSYDDLSPAMADAVRKNLPTYWASINRMGRASAAKLIETNKDGDQLYVVDQRGGGTHWNMIVNPDGKIASAFICQGTGL